MALESSQLMTVVHIVFDPTLLWLDDRMLLMSSRKLEEQFGQFRSSEKRFG